MVRLILLLPALGCLAAGILVTRSDNRAESTTFPSVPLASDAASSAATPDGAFLVPTTVTTTNNEPTRTTHRSRRLRLVQRNNTFDRCPVYREPEPYPDEWTSGPVHTSRADRENYCCAHPKNGVGHIIAHNGQQTDMCRITKYRGACKDREANMGIYVHGPYCCAWAGRLGAKKHLSCGGSSTAEDGLP